MNNEKNSRMIFFTIKFLTVIFILFSFLRDYKYEFMMFSYKTIKSDAFEHEMDALNVQVIPFDAVTLSAADVGINEREVDFINHKLAENQNLFVSKFSVYAHLNGSDKIYRIPKISLIKLMIKNYEKNMSFLIYLLIAVIFILCIRMPKKMKASDYEKVMLSLSEAVFIFTFILKNFSYGVIFNRCYENITFYLYLILFISLCYSIKNGKLIYISLVLQIIFFIGTITVFQFRSRSDADSVVNLIQVIVVLFCSIRLILKDMNCGEC